MTAALVRFLFAAAAIAGLSWSIRTDDEMETDVATIFGADMDLAFLKSLGVKDPIEALMKQKPGFDQKQLSATDIDGIKQYLEAIKKDAAEFLVYLESWLGLVASKTGGQLQCAPLKGVDRSVEKIVEYLQEGKSQYDLVDIGRCAVIYKDAGTLCNAIDEVPSIASKDGNTLNNPSCKSNADQRCFGFVRLKNRFATPVASGYADIFTNILVSSKLNYWHVGEVQFHILPLIAAKEGQQSWLPQGAWDRVAQAYKQANPSETPKSGHEYYNIERETTKFDEATRAKAVQDGKKLYVAALKLCGCDQVTGSNIAAEIAQSGHCACLPKINDQSLKIDLEQLQSEIVGSS